MNELLNSITPMIQKLSEVFCVSVDTIQANAMTYIVEYGKYALVKNVFGGIVVTSLCVMLIWGIILALLTIEEFFYKREGLALKLTIGILAIAVVTPVIYNITLYLSSPEIYGIEAVMRLIK